MKNVLIIAAEYPPSATVGAKRPAKLAARIAEHGWSPCVLTMAEGDYELTDTSSVTDAIRAVPTARVPCGSIWIRSQRWRQSSPGLPRLAEYRMKVRSSDGAGLPPWALGRPNEQERP
ncbi:MAG TPA: hypothetical protein ENH80_10625 [Phycisphaerae bacterium]|nr:hypothetical protein [Phycisphaerae bacterium]HDZ44382.1 hypothetical protein [Phycisphaerae bacterium]